ncbi:ArsC/Spx/MgsR family protein [Sphingomonas rubra]|uniref:Arsenate reductase n=1 Tax=Sphingomonas rubra TaxID=634430 RepID=A0A1I5PQ56_9SPHN|nr:ArsC/Spx/MgsR family protein [Sphingomonas rubra]SFP36037.1 arsenate reductase [Sphingomonas rubra]
MGRATIYHNPRCSKSRAALALLQEAGADITIIDYLQNPPSTQDLARLANRAGLTAHQLLRPDAPKLAADAVFAAITANPALLERPLVETSNGVVLARPPERVHDIL